jgi:hypothetical protein
MKHVLESILSPAGRAEEVQLSPAPLFNNVVGMMLILAPTNPLVPVDPEKLITGVFAPIAKMTLVEVGPFEFVATTVKVVEDNVTVGVPLITQVELLIESPAGRATVVEQDVIDAPRAISVVGVIDIATPTIPVVPVAPA